MSYLNDVVKLRHGTIEDGAMRFSRRAEAPEPARARTA
jgi:hypothetical protein